MEKSQCPQNKRRRAGSRVSWAQAEVGAGHSHTKVPSLLTSPAGGSGGDAAELGDVGQSRD